MIDVDFSYLTKDDIPDARKEEIQKSQSNMLNQELLLLKNKLGLKKLDAIIYALVVVGKNIKNVVVIEFDTQDFFV